MTTRKIQTLSLRNVSLTEAQEPKPLSVQHKISGSRGGEPATDVDSVTPRNRSANGDRFIGQCSSHTKWITWNARSSDRSVGSACERLWWFCIAVRMIRGCFVAVTRPDAFVFAVWIKSKNLE